MSTIDRTGASDAEFRARVAAFDAAPTPPECDPERVETVARELANHQGLRGPMDESRPDVWQNRCDCGWDDGDERPGWRERYRLHVAAAAIAALPPTPAEEAVKRVEALDPLSYLSKREEIDEHARGWNDALRFVDEDLRAALASPAPAPQDGQHATDEVTDRG